MNLVVSDSSPLRYLVLCEAIQVIPQIYGQLVIPASVAEELIHAHAPAPVRAWIKSLPAWAAIRSARQLDPAEQLGRGEREAIALAGELQATELLVDERLARRLALERGLRITGTVGILEKAAEMGLLNLAESLQKLSRTNFRIDPQVIREALEREAARPRPTPDRPKNRGLER